VENIRPFYTEFAWAYDLIIEAPVSSRCSFVEDVVSQRGLPPSSTILDAGCGTGSYCVELAKRGFAVTGIDACPQLVSVAREKARDASISVTFQVGDILELPSEPKYDAIMCRGVLNDIIQERSRQEVFFSLARALCNGGTLILDVRQWESSARRKETEPVFERTVQLNRLLNGGRLTFRAVTQLDYEKRQLLVEETHVLELGEEASTTVKHEFVMRCWTEEELLANLTKAGFRSITCLGDYDLQTPVMTTDRIVAIASLAF